MITAGGNYFMRTEWKSFTGGAWEKEINVRDFIQQNYTPYEGDGTYGSRFFPLPKKNGKRAGFWTWILKPYPP